MKVDESKKANCAKKISHCILGIPSTGYNFLATRNKLRYPWVGMPRLAKVAGVYRLANLVLVARLAWIF